MTEILIVDDEAGICEALASVCEREGHRPLIASTGAEAIAVMERRHPPLVLLDVQLPDMTGIEVLGRIRAAWPETVVVVMTAYGTMTTAMQAMQGGAFEYLGKPLELRPLRALLQRALEHALASAPGAGPATPAAPDPDQDGRRELIGQSPVMQEVFKLMSLLTDNELTVLVTGESGVGKELVARGIHAHGPRRDRPFVAVNCAAIPHHLLESELFGHERGAFTGATLTRAGRCEAAADGTLFLDEIGELPFDLQSKLLRVLQERHFERLGSNVQIALRARLIAATNRDLATEVAVGRFREDLYHRINLVRLEVPPLRRRTDDIPLLAASFLARANRDLNRAIQEIDPGALAVLRAYPWPGNVRELENAIRKAVLLTQGRRLTAVDFSLDLAGSGTANPAGPDLPLGALRRAAREALGLSLAIGDAATSSGVFQQVVMAVEDTLIEEALRLTRGNQVAGARLLGLSRTTLRKKLDRAGQTHDEEESDALCDH
jgi:DNA-binding NtrC family response regulator